MFQSKIVGCAVRTVNLLCAGLCRCAGVVFLQEPGTPYVVHLGCEMDPLSSENTIIDE
jgi:hypothetical protein